MEKEKLICRDCGCIIDVDDEYHDMGDGVICDDCFDSSYFYCDHCGCIESLDYLCVVRESNYEEYWCEYCADNDAYICNHCGQLYRSSQYLYSVYDEDMRMISVCGSCFEDSYSYCEGCGEYYHYTLVDDGYCRDCRDNNSILDDYHDNKGYTHWFAGEKEKEIGYGVELEVDREDYDDRSIVNTIDAINRIADGHFFFEKDGSLDYGFEIISHPHTKSQFLKLDWKSILNACLENGFKSHDIGTCGLHFHVSKEKFGKTETEIERNIGKINLFYESNWDDIVKISRRDIGKMEQWADKYIKDGEVTKKKIKYIYKNRFSHGRYKAINIQNNDTIEFRHFRGTLNYNSFMAAFDFIDTICRNCKKIKWNDASNAELWLKGMKPETLSYLKNRNAFKTVL